MTLPRHVAMYLCRRHTDAPLGVIGKELGGRDHSTVVHALGAIEDAAPPRCGAASSRVAVWRHGSGGDDEVGGGAGGGQGWRREAPAAS